MQVTDSDLDLIIRLIDNELTEMEEAALLERMEHEDDLRQAFDQQLLMSPFLTEEPFLQIETPAFESADDYLARVRQLSNEPVGETPISLPVKKRNYWQIAAAAAIIVGLLGGVIYFSNTRTSTRNNVVKKENRNELYKDKDTALARPDSSLLLAENNLLPDLASDYYKPLAENGLEVPSSPSIYSSLYLQKNYPEMAAMDESSVITKGQGSEATEKETLAYFNFYKALSNIEIKKNEVAVKLLKRVVPEKKSFPELGRAAQWYLLMLYLKNNDKPNSILTCKAIVQDIKSPYNKKAVIILSMLIP